MCDSVISGALLGARANTFDKNCTLIYHSWMIEIDILLMITRI